MPSVASWLLNRDTFFNVSDFPSYLRPLSPFLLKRRTNFLTFMAFQNKLICTLYCSLYRWIGKYTFIIIFKRIHIQCHGKHLSIYTSIKDLLISNRHVSLLMSQAKKSLQGLWEYLIFFFFTQMLLNLLPFSNNSLIWWHSFSTRTHLLQRRWLGPSFSNKHHSLCTTRAL